MSERSQQQEEKRRYILTCDLSHRFAQLGHIGIKIPDNGFLEDFNSELKKLIQKSFPDAEIVAFDTNQLADEILEVAIERQRELDGYVISTCVDFAVPSRGSVIEINRLFDLEGRMIGIGPRPGHRPISAQLDGIASVAQKRPVILVEDGTFSGATLVNIVKELKKHYVKTKAIVIGFAFSKGIARIQEEFDGELVVINKLDNLIDWMPDHDFFPFAPNCGRVLGVTIGNNFSPYYDHNGASFSIPYIRPFCPMEEWTSIPHEHHYPVSFFCLDKAVEFFKEMDAINKRKIRVKDLIGVNPRISIALNTSNGGYLPTVHEGIGDYLHSIHSSCW